MKRLFLILSLLSIESLFSSDTDKIYPCSGAGRSGPTPTAPPQDYHSDDPPPICDLHKTSTVEEKNPADRALIPLCKKMFHCSGNITALAVNPGGERTITGHIDRSGNTTKYLATVWSTKRGKARYSLEGHIQRINGAAITNDGERAITVSNDGTIKLWNISDGKIIYSYDEDNPINAVAISSDDRLAVTASRNFARIFLIDTDRKCPKPSYKLTEHRDAVKAVAFTPDSKKVVTCAGSSDKRIRTWNTKTGDLLSECVAGGSMIALSTNGKIAAASPRDMTIRLFDTTTGKCVYTHGNSDDSIVTINHNGTQIVTVSEDTPKQTRVWNTETGECLLDYFDIKAMRAIFSYDNTLVATRSEAVYRLGYNPEHLSTDEYNAMVSLAKRKKTHSLDEKNELIARLSDTEIKLLEENKLISTELTPAELTPAELTPTKGGRGCCAIM